MNKKTSFVMLVIAILVAAIFVVVVPLDIYTGTVDTDTHVHNIHMWFVGAEGDSWGYCNGELMDTEYATSWADNAFSETITLDAGYKPNLFVYSLPRFTGYYWRVYIDDQNSGVTEVIGVNPDGSAKINSDYVLMKTGTAGFHTFSGNTISDGWGMCGVDKRFYQISDPTYNATTLDAQTITFKILGQRFGIIRSELVLDTQHWWDVSGEKCAKNTVVVSDEAHLYSGVGTITVKDNQEPPYGGTTNFEEGHTVNFQVDTGYAGEVSEGYGWLVDITHMGTSQVLSMYDEYGDSLETPFTLKNGWVNYDFYWDIPEGTYVEGQTSQWEITLKNTLTTEDDDRFFALYEGASEDAPGPTTMTINDPPSADGHWHQGDEVQVHMEANENPNAPPGLDGIYEFEVWAYWGTYSDTEIQEYPRAIEGAGGKYHADYEFTISKFSNTDLVVECIAFSNPGKNLGGLPSLGPIATEYIHVYEDPTDGYTLEVYVTRNFQPLSDVDISIKTDSTVIKTGETNVYGIARFHDLQNGRYTVEAVYGDTIKSRPVDIEGSDEDIHIVMDEYNIVAIIVAIIIATAGILIGVLLPVAPAIRIVPIIVAILVAVFVYLYMTGFLYIG